MHETTFLFFDEIFGSQGEERRASLLTALKHTGVPLPSGLLLITPITGIPGGFANTLIHGIGTANKEPDPGSVR